MSKVHPASLIQAGEVLSTAPQPVNALARRANFEGHATNYLAADPAYWQYAKSQMPSLRKFAPEASTWLEAH